MQNMHNNLYKYINTIQNIKEINLKCPGIRTSHV